MSDAKFATKDETIQCSEPRALEEGRNKHSQMGSEKFRSIHSKTPKMPELPDADLTIFYPFIIILYYSQILYFFFFKRHHFKKHQQRISFIGIMDPARRLLRRAWTATPASTSKISKTISNNNTSILIELDDLSKTPNLTPSRAQLPRRHSSASQSSTTSTASSALDQTIDSRQSRAQQAWTSYW